MPLKTLKAPLTLAGFAAVLAGGAGLGWSLSSIESTTSQRGDWIDGSFTPGLAQVCPERAERVFVRESSTRNSLRTAVIAKGTNVRVIEESLWGTTAWYRINWMDRDDPKRQIDGWVQADALSGHCPELKSVRNEEVILLRNTERAPNPDRFARHALTENTSPHDVKTNPQTINTQTFVQEQSSTQNEGSASTPATIEINRRSNSPTRNTSNTVQTTQPAGEPAPIRPTPPKNEPATRPQHSENRRKGSERNTLTPREWAEWITSDTPPWEGERPNTRPDTQALTPQQWRAKLSHINISEGPICLGIPEPYTGFRDLERLRRLSERYQLYSVCLANLDQREMTTFKETVQALGGTLHPDDKFSLPVTTLCDQACNDAFWERFEGVMKRRDRLRRDSITFGRQSDDFLRQLPQ